MRTVIFRSDRVSLGSPAYAEAKAKATRVCDVLRRQGRTSAIRWDDEYNDTNTLGTFAVIAED